MHRISAHSVIIDSCSVDELVVKLSGEERIGKFSKELFQQTGNAIYVVLERFGVSEIDLGCIWIMSVFTPRMNAFHTPLSNRAFICWI